MTLRDVARALERLEAATLTQLAAELRASPAEVEVLLEFWERRGDARRCHQQATTSCGTTCRACPIGSGPAGRGAGAASPTPDGGTVVYEWVRREAVPSGRTPVGAPRRDRGHVGGDASRRRR